MGVKTSLSKPEPRTLIDAHAADSLIEGELVAATFTASG